MSKKQVKSDAEKYHLILDLLQRNLGETLFFINSYSYFKKFELKIDFKKDLYLQEVTFMDNGDLPSYKEVYDNFFIVNYLTCFQKSWLLFCSIDFQNNNL